METEAQAAEIKRWSDFNTRVAVAIAVMSVAGAAVGYRASLAGIDAEDLVRKHVEERMQVEAERLELEAQLERDVSLNARFQVHFLSAQLLGEQAQDASRRNQAELGAALGMQAQAELALARSMIPFFRIQYPTLSEDKPGVADYDRNAVFERMRVLNTVLRTVHPEKTKDQVETAHRRTLNFELAAAFFVGSVFCLTLAEFGPSFAKVVFVWVGSVAAVAGSAYWGLVEAGLLR